MSNAIEMQQARDAARVMDGRELIYPGDELLPAPEVYYNPENPQLRFKVWRDPEFSMDPRKQRNFQPEPFINGRYVAYTKFQRDAVRRVLGHNADLWKGDDMKIELRCPRQSCGLVTRNTEVWKAHGRFTGHFESGM